MLQFWTSQTAQLCPSTVDKIENSERHLGFPVDGTQWKS